MKVKQCDSLFFVLFCFFDNIGSWRVDLFKQTACVNSYYFSGCFGLCIAFVDSKTNVLSFSFKMIHNSVS